MYILISLLSINLNQIKLNEKIMKVLSFDSYEKNFVFIVNNEQFKTSRIIADILSPKINKLHLTHPSVNECVVNTKNHGNFSYYLQLINFNLNGIPESQIAFIDEVATILGNQFIEYKSDDDQIEITIDNVIDRIKLHEQYPHIYSKQIKKEADFLASHFYMLNVTQEDSFCTMNKFVLDRIFNNTKLVLKSEDQLLNIINTIYKNDFNCSYMYNYIHFNSVSNEGIASFLQFIKFDDLTPNIWQSISSRNIPKADMSSEKSRSDKRYSGQIFEYSEDNRFSGILKYLKDNTELDEEISITASSVRTQNFDMTKLIDDKGTSFYSDPETNPWVCFEFKKHILIPTNYTIYTNQHYNDIKSWVVEGSNDKQNWIIIDEHSDCNCLKNSFYHTFSIKKQIEIKYFRIRMTGPDWDGGYFLRLTLIEIFGKLQPRK